MADEIFGLSIEKRLRANLPTQVDPDAGDILFFCEDGSIHITDNLGFVREIGRPDVSPLADNAIELRDRKIYYKDLENRGILEKLNVNEYGQLLYDGTPIGIKLSDNKDNALVIAEDGLLVKIDNKLDKGSNNPISNRIATKYFEEINNQIEKVRQNLITKIREQGVNASLDDSFDNIATHIEELGKSGGSGSTGISKLKISSINQYLEVEPILPKNEYPFIPIFYKTQNEYGTRIYDPVNREFHEFRSVDHGIYSVDNNTCTTMKALPKSVARGCVVIYRGILYAMGGGSNTYNNNNSYVYQWDRDTDTWTLSDFTLPNNRGSFSACVAPDADGIDCIWIFQGCTGSTNTKSTQKYSPETGWVDMAEFPDANRNTQTVYCPYNNSFYCLRRYTSSTIYSFVKYSIEDDIWSTIVTPDANFIASPSAQNAQSNAYMTIGNEIFYISKSGLAAFNVDTLEFRIVSQPTRALGNAFFYEDDIFYFPFSQNTNTCFIRYNMKDNKWIYRYNSPFYAIKYGATLLHDNKFYVAGNYAPINSDGDMASRFLCCDLATGEWETLEDIPINAATCGLAWFDGKIHIIGTNVAPYKSHLTYDIDTKEFEVLPTPDYAISNVTHSCIEYKGELHAIGSYRHNGGKSHFVYNKDTKKWTMLNPTPLSFYYSTALVINDKIHVFGGSGSAANHYVWDEVNDTWELLGTSAGSNTESCLLIYSCGCGYTLNNKTMFNFVPSNSPKSTLVFTSANSSWGTTLSYTDIESGWTYVLVPDRDNFWINDAGSCFFKIRLINSIEMSVEDANIFIKNAKDLLSTSDGVREIPII